MSFNKKILITGDAGFLGSHLTEKLLKEGNGVLVVDNYITGYKENVAHLLPNLPFRAHASRIRQQITKNISQKRSGDLPIFFENNKGKKIEKMER